MMLYFIVWLIVSYPQEKEQHKNRSHDLFEQRLLHNYSLTTKSKTL